MIERKFNPLRYNNTYLYNDADGDATKPLLFGHCRSDFLKIYDIIINHFHQSNSYIQ